MKQRPFILIILLQLFIISCGKPQEMDSVEKVYDDVIYGEVDCNGLTVKRAYISPQNQIIKDSLRCLLLLPVPPNAIITLETGNGLCDPFRSVRCTWLRNDNYIQSTESFVDVSEYFGRGFNISPEKAYSLVVPPDGHYLAIDVSYCSLDRIYISRDTYERKPPVNDIDKLVYLFNLNNRYIQHSYLLEVLNIDDYVQLLYDENHTGYSELGIRIPATAALQAARIVTSEYYDVGLIGCPKDYLIECTLKLTREIIKSFSQWAFDYEWGMWFYELSATMLLLKDYYNNDDFNELRRIAEIVADSICNLSPKSLYWKLEDENEESLDSFGEGYSYGNTKSDNCVFCCLGLGMVVLMFPDLPDIAKYRTNFIKLSCLKTGTKSDASSKTKINGFELGELEGYNIASNGFLINHGILHPSYLALTILPYLSLGPLYKMMGEDIPVATIHNLSLVLNAMTNYSFKKGDMINNRPVLPPYGTIAREGCDYLYEPQGNDWGKEVFFGSGYIWKAVSICNLEKGSYYDRFFSSIIDRQMALQKRFKNGKMYAGSEEFNYDKGSHGAEIIMADLIGALLFAYMFPPSLSYADWTIG